MSTPDLPMPEARNRRGRALGLTAVLLALPLASMPMGAASMNITAGRGDLVACCATPPMGAASVNITAGRGDLVACCATPPMDAALVNIAAGPVAAQGRSMPINDGPGEAGHPSPRDDEPGVTGDAVMAPPDGDGQASRDDDPLPRPGLPLDHDPLPGLGMPLDPQELAGLPQTVYPDGRGLPPGSGTALRGAALYAALCTQCHGPEGRGGSAPDLAGGRSPLDSEYPDQNIGNWWPYATTLFDFIRRAMPMFAPGSLSDEDCYALTAYLLERNGLWPRERTLDAEGLASVRMPNRDGFDSHWPDRGPAKP